MNLRRCTLKNNLKDSSIYKYSRVYNGCLQYHFCDNSTTSAGSSMLHLDSWGEFRFESGADGRLGDKKVYYLWFVLNGSFLFQRSGECFKLQPGDFLIVRPGEIQKKFVLNGSLSGRARFLRISPGFHISAFVENVPFTLHDVFHPENFNEIITAVETLDSIGERGTVVGADLREIRRELSCRVYEIFTLLIKGLGSGETDKLGEIIDFMMQNMRSNLTLADIEERFHIERHSLSRMIRQQRNASPMKLLRVFRLEYSSRLLKTTTSTVSEIAFLCGFSSASVYSRIFRKYYGLSPQVYRTTFDASTKEHGSDEPVVKLAKNMRQQKIFYLVNVNPYITREELAKATGLTLSGVDWNIRSLKKQGVLNRFGTPRKGKWHPVTEYRL